MGAKNINLLWKLGECLFHLSWRKWLPSYIWRECSFFFRCDRRNDCGDSSDERGCIYEPCQQHQFTCQNGRCISKAYICDGDNDCGDESDELEHLCSTPEATCSPHHFKCDNGNCIELVKVCNRLDDCLDNSDEKGCGMYKFICTV